jgi:hypothetical protein
MSLMDLNCYEYDIRGKYMLVDADHFVLCTLISFFLSAAFIAWIPFF